MSSVELLTKLVNDNAVQLAHITKISRTHLQAAVPLIVGQEWSGYAVQLADAVEVIKLSMKGLYNLAIGGLL